MRRLLIWLLFSRRERNLITCLLATEGWNMQASGEHEYATRSFELAYDFNIGTVMEGVDDE